MAAHHAAGSVASLQFSFTTVLNISVDEFSL